MPEIKVEVKTPKAKTEGKVVKVDFAKPRKTIVDRFQK